MTAPEIETASLLRSANAGSEADTPKIRPFAQELTALPQDVVRDRGDVWTCAYLLLFTLYVALGLAVRWAGWIHGDAAWFAAAARKVLDGSLDLYSFRSAQGLIPPEGATYAYSPLTAIILAPFVGVADALGWGEAGAEWLMGVPLLVADVLAMQQLRLLVRSWHPSVDERYLFSGVVVTLFLTSLLGDSAYYSHNEGLMLLFVLLALRLTPNNLVVGGVCAGLAVATKHTTLLNLLPVWLVLLAGARATNVTGAEGSGRRKFRFASPVSAIVWVGIAIGVFAAFMIIPIVRYPDQVYYAFVTQIALLPFFGSGLPVLVDRGLYVILNPADYANIHVDLLYSANWVLVGVVALASALIVWRSSRSGQPIRLIDSRLLALVGFAAVAQVVLGKWASGHYYQLPLAFVFLWDVVRRAPNFGGGRALQTSSLDSFPWIGLGAAVAFRSITQLGIWWFKDSMLLALFTTLAVLTLLDAWKTGKRQEGPAQSVL